MRSIVVGTAGHIDHGKTALVRALTGVDADRLPEEKRRGITIDLGFADLELDDLRLGFVDVPGHERFVKNMLAGAHGIDLLALVIAADEGVMPQTREHFDICRLLGVQSGLVVLTKSDAVDEELLELVRLEASELVAGSFLEGARVVAASARTGQGLEELKEALRASALAAPERSGDAVARLPVDRSFTMRGFGAVATGTLVAGEIKEGDELELLPAGVRVRVRGLQVHGASVGTAEVLARVAALEDSGEIAPGSEGLVQLRLESPVVALPGDRFILRTYSPQQTFAGGVVLDAHAPKHRGRERASARAKLAAFEGADATARLAFFVE